MRADVDVHHDSLRPAGGREVAVCRGQRHDLEQAQDRLGDRPAEILELLERFLYGEGVGAGIQEEVFHPLRDQRFDVAFSSLTDSVCAGCQCARSPTPALVATFRSPFSVS